MKIVFHGGNASSFAPGFQELVGDGHEIVCVSDMPSGADATAFASADVLIGVSLNRDLPRPERVRLYHAPAAGVDLIDRACLPAGTPVCCCFGHEPAITEYVMSALLMRHVPIAAADRALRAKDWSFYPGKGAPVRSELRDRTIGLVGYGHIGREVAQRAKAFGMRVHAVNRSVIPADGIVDQRFGLDELPAFMASADYIVCTLPLTADTRGLIDARAIAAMHPEAVVLNVGRGPVIDAAALYAALKEKRIGGAVIDTWWIYPSADDPNPRPASLPFHELDDCTLTSHMSAWTEGTIRRRQETMADNIKRLCSGDPLVNVV